MMRRQDHVTQVQHELGTRDRLSCLIGDLSDKMLDLPATSALLDRHNIPPKAGLRRASTLALPAVMANSKLRSHFSGELETMSLSQVDLGSIPIGM